METVRPFRIEYNHKESHFEINLFNKKILGSYLTARIGKTKAKATQVVTSKTMNTWGEYEEWIIDFECEEKAKGGFQGVIKVYSHCAVFEIINKAFIKGKKKKHAFGNPYISFPCFEGSEFEDDCSCLTYKRQAPFNYPQIWYGKATDSLREGKNVPIIITNKSYETLVLSPLNHFLYGTVSINHYPPMIRCGIPRFVTKIPKETSYQTILVYGQGVHHTVTHWGNLLQDYHKVQPIKPQEDCLLKYISYWTNAGSAYWYKGYRKNSYDETFQKLHKHHESIGLEFGSYQLDSWWYKKDGDQYTSSITDWEPKGETQGKNFNSLFSFFKKNKNISLFKEDKLSYVQTLLKKPFGCHFKQLSADSVYVLGSKEDFIIDGFALPKNEEVAYGLFKSIFNHPKWRISFIVHDWIQWMNDQHKGFKDIEVGEGYFNALNKACMDTVSVDNQHQHLSLQLCMTQPHMTLNSSSMQAVTTIRSTSDSNSFFIEGTKRWWWHTYSCVLIQALGKYAFYDNRRTQKSSLLPYTPYPTFEMIMLALSCGPIGLGDKIGAENMSLIQKVIKDDGEIIKPDQSSYLLDRCYLVNPYNNTCMQGVTTYSYSTLVGNSQDMDYKIHYFLSYNTNPLGKKVQVTFRLNEVIHDYVDQNETEYILYDYVDKTMVLIHRDTENLFILKRRKFFYHICAPIVLGFAFIGDVQKHISGSKQLFNNLIIRQNEVSIERTEPKSKTNQTLVCYCQLKPQKVSIDDLVLEFVHKENKLTIDIPGNCEGKHIVIHLL